MIIDDINQEKLARMLVDIVDREMSRTQELPVVVDVMVQHEVILSRVEGLERPTELSEFEVALLEWQAKTRFDMTTTATMPAFVESDLAEHSRSSCWT